MSDYELRSEFVEGIKGLRNRIIKKIRPKQINDQLVNGPMLIELAESYCEAINSG